MKNLLKKLGVMTASVMLMMTTFAMPSFAAADGSMTIEGVKYVKKDNVETKVEGYQIVSKNAKNEWVPNPTYITKSGTGKENDPVVWKVTGTNISYPVPAVGDAELPSAAALEELAKIAKGQTKTIDFTNTAGTDKWKSATNVAQGSYLVLVKDNASTETYNPMLVSKDDTAAGDVTAGNVTLPGSTTAYAKKSEIPFEKVVDRRAPHNTGTNAQNENVTGDGITGDDAKSPVDADTKSGPDGNRGDTAGTKGGGATTDTSGTLTYTDATEFDDVWFRINTKVPSYADNYFAYDTKPQFIVYDKLTGGLTFNDVEGNGDNLGMSVKVGNDTIYKSNADVTITKKPTSGKYNGKIFVVEFTQAGLKKYGGEYVEICYSAKLNKEHGVNFDGEKNTASLEYTRNPGEEPKKGEDKTTYHYTFTINGNVDGMAKEENREVIKIGLDDNGEQVLKETSAIKEEGWKPLKGVKFELQDEQGNKVKDVVTDAAGILRGMDQIDAGKYKLVEQSPLPDEYKEYKVNTNPIDVEITAVLDNVGRLESYKVMVGGIVVGNYKKIYSDDGDKVQFLKNDDDNVVVAEMPCTGDNAGTITNTNIGNVGRHVFDKGVTYKDTDTEAADIINSKTGTLPSTGGMGTILFTIGGIVLIGLAFLLLFGGKRRKTQNN